MNMIQFKTEPKADLQFSFPVDLKWEEMDKQGVRVPAKMKFVDIIIERENDILLVEVKDPSNINTPATERARYLKSLQDNSILTQELTPKARDSYTYLHLMKRDTKPFKFVVLLGLEAFENHAQLALLGNFKNRLLSNVRCEAAEPWKRIYIADCVVMSVEKWNEVFSEWPVVRLSRSAQNQLSTAHNLPGATN
jgi:hypothetical protein